MYNKVHSSITHNSWKLETENALEEQKRQEYSHHRSAPCPVVIGEASSASRWEWVQWPTQTLYGEKESKLEVSSDPSRAQGTPQKRGRKDYRNQRTWRTPGEHRPPNQLSGAHMDSQRLKHRACQFLHQVLCAYIVAVRMVDLWDS